jgi:hypothetical protein
MRTESSLIDDLGPRIAQRKSQAGSWAGARGDRVQCAAPRSPCLRAPGPATAPRGRETAPEEQREKQTERTGEHENNPDRVLMGITRFYRRGPGVARAVVGRPGHAGGHERSRPGQVARRRSKNERYRWKAVRRSSVETSLPWSHWLSSRLRSSANVRARCCMSSATRPSPCSTA